MNFLLKNNLIIIIIISFFTRLASIIMFRDTKVDNEWGILLDNLVNHGVLSVHTVQDVLVPNIFMPPLYPFFLYAVKIFFNNLELYLWTVQFIQLIFGVISIYLIYLITRNLFSRNLSIIGTGIFSLFPLNVYAVSQISSITIQIFLLNLFIYSYLKIFKDVNYKHIFLFSISSALLILLRGEFFVFVILSLIYLYIKNKKLDKVLIISLITVLIISPYLYRNYKLFNVVTITKSSGYNLLKGNHPRTKVEGTGMFLKVEQVIPEVKSELEKLKSEGPQVKYDLLQDQILMDQAIKFIKENPFKYLNLYFKKFLSFMFIDLDSSYPNYYSPMHTIPKIIISIFSFFGMIIVFSMRINITNYFILFYLANISLFSVFFILPRYSLSLLTIQTILSLFTIKKINSYLKL